MLCEFIQLLRDHSSYAPTSVATRAPSVIADGSCQAASAMISERSGADFTVTRLESAPITLTAAIGDYRCGTCCARTTAQELHKFTKHGALAFFTQLSSKLQIYISQLYELFFSDLNRWLCAAKSGQVHRNRRLHSEWSPMGSLPAITHSHSMYIHDTKGF